MYTELEHREMGEAERRKGQRRNVFRQRRVSKEEISFRIRGSKEANVLLSKLISHSFVRVLDFGNTKAGATPYYRIYKLLHGHLRAIQVRGNFVS